MGRSTFFHKAAVLQKRLGNIKNKSTDEDSIPGNSFIEEQFGIAVEQLDLAGAALNTLQRLIEEKYPQDYPEILGTLEFITVNLNEVLRAIFDDGEDDDESDNGDSNDKAAKIRALKSRLARIKIPSKRRRQCVVNADGSHDPSRPQKDKLEQAVDLYEPFEDYLPEISESEKTRDEVAPTDDSPYHRPKFSKDRPNAKRSLA